MAKIYDTFAFFNELDLLQIRLDELSSVVDHFVLVEATRTFQKKPKPLYFTENKEKFKPYLDKIIHVVVDTYPSFFRRLRVPTTWDYDNGQKEFILEGLKEASPEDVIIVSDIDEIPLASKILEYKDRVVKNGGIYVFEQYLSNFYLNNVCTYLGDGHYNRDGFGYWRGSVMLQKKDIKTIKKTRVKRGAPDNEVTVIPEGGWHFSYMGGVDQIIKKIESWTHAEHNLPQYKNPDYILKAIYEGRSLFDTTTHFKVMDPHGPLPFPKALINNKAYADMFLPVK